MAAFSSDEQRCLLQQVEVEVVCPTPVEKLRCTYDLNRCDVWIKTNELSKVCLQFPDHLLCDAADISLSLQQSSGAECYILGDTSYGSCCVDEVSAEHVRADGIIHFGHACLSPTRRLPVLYIFQSKPIDVEVLVNAVKTYFEDVTSKLLVFYDISYSHRIEELHSSLSHTFPNAVSAHPNVQGSFKQEKLQTCLGHCFNLIESTTVDEYHVLFIGKDGRSFTNLLLELMACKVSRYDPEESSPSVQPADEKISKFLMKRLHLVERVKDARTLGILIGTLGVDGYLNAVDQIKSLAKKTGKKTYIFAVGRPNVPKLANFPEVDVFVLVACPENSLLDWKEFYQPVVSLYEVELACNSSRQWSSKYVTDFRQLLCGENDYVEAPDTSNEDIVDVSLITGKVRRIDICSKDVNTEDMAVATRANLSVCVSTGSQYLASRSWKGLEQSLGETPVNFAVEGRSGIASSYLSEPTHEEQE